MRMWCVSVSERESEGGGSAPGVSVQSTLRETHTKMINAPGEAVHKRRKVLILPDIHNDVKIAGRRFRRFYNTRKRALLCQHGGAHEEIAKLAV